MPSDSKVQAKKSKKRALEDAEEPTPAPVAGPSKPKPKLPAIVGMDDDAAEESDTEVAESASASAPGNPKKKHKSKGKSAGIVYISRLPPGMTPQKVRHLMARWGDVGRLYAQHRDAPSGYNAHHQEDKKQKKRHTSANYNEAWVEFLDKSVAKTVAKMLNAQVIGGKKGDRWRDDIWTMKYLSGFKWEMLGEQVAYERQVHQSRLRAEVQRSKAEQGAYLQNVELARVLKKREEKRGAAEASTSGSGATAPAGDAASTQDKDKDSKGKRSYKQRQVQDRAHGLEAKGMDDVLGNIFG